MKKSVSEGNFFKFNENKLDVKIKDLQSDINEIKIQNDNLKLKIEPLLDLLQTLIDNNISKEPKKEEPKKDLCYKEENNFVYIYGKKTYDHKDIIKFNFNSTWDKNKMSWCFKVFNDYEKLLKEKFPDITKDQ